MFFFGQHGKIESSDIQKSLPSDIQLNYSTSTFCIFRCFHSLLSLYLKSYFMHAVHLK